MIDQRILRMLIHAGELQTELLAEVERLRGLLKANECCTACGKYLGQCNDEVECIRLGGWTMEEVE